jgi:hypothetical protein
MPTIDVDITLNRYLGLPDDYQIDKTEAFKLYQYFMKLFPVDRPIDHWKLLFYIDKHGDFVNDPKNKQDYVVKAIHDNMEMSDQFETLKYIEYYTETKGFTRTE